MLYITYNGCNKNCGALSHTYCFHRLLSQPFKRLGAPWFSSYSFMEVIFLKAADFLLTRVSQVAVLEAGKKGREG